MKVPSYTSEKVVDPSGYFTSPWQILFQTLLQQLQQSVGDEGFVMPTLDNDQINRIDITKMLNGTVIYDSSDDKLKVKLADGTLHVIQTI